MATVTQTPGSIATHTITLASLASSTTAGQQGTAIDNSSDLAPDAELFGKFMTGASPVAGGTVDIFVYGSGDGTTFAAGMTGSNGAITPTSYGALYLAGSIQVSATGNTSYTFHFPSLAAVFGKLPASKWGVFVRNNSGGALHGTGSNHEVKSKPIKYSSA